MRLIAALFLSILLPGIKAQDRPSLFNSDPLSCFSMSGAPASNLSIVPVQGQPFTRALQIRTPENNSANPWDIRARCFNTRAVQKGDTIVASFWIRASSAKSGNAYTVFVLEQNASPYAKSVEWTTAAGPEWRQVQIPFLMRESYGTGSTDGYNLSFWVTFEPQEIEIADLRVSNYGANVSLRDLNLPGWPYEGHDADAPWRREADRRIEKYRKGDILVVARDAQGMPIADAPVHVRMKRHAFGFGTAVVGTELRDNPKYLEVFLQSFNKAVLENEMKWPFWESWGRPGADFALPWFQQNGISMVRGHNVIWPGNSNLPNDVKSLVSANDKDALRKRINDHIAQVMSYSKGRVTEWDVLNEPYTNKDVQRVLGDAEMAEWFKQARAADPGVKLYINDYDITEKGGFDFKHQQALETITQQILDNGGPIDGIGLQSHFDGNLTPPEKVWQILDRYSKFGKELQITEFDVIAGDTQIEADYTRDYLTATFAHPAVTGFMLWGFWESRHWRPESALWRKDWSLKPNGEVWMQRIYKDWWTDVEGRTGTDGVFRTRGFLGEYEVDVNSGGTTRTLPLTVGKEPAVAAVGTVAKGILNQQGVVNAASFKADPVVPGSIVTIFGTGIGPRELAVAAYDTDRQLPTFLGDTRVLFDGKAAPMVYAANGQISAIVPQEVNATTRVQVEWLGVKTDAIEVPVRKASPAIFTADSSGRGQARAVNVAADGTTSLNAVDRPAARGSYLTFFVTGHGAVTPASPDGQLPAGTPPPQLPIAVSFGDIPARAEDIWSGLVYAGVLQVNVRIREDAPVGNSVPLTIRVGEVVSPGSVTVVIR